ncbi:MAG: hypothetical protein KDD92_17295, partial [Caldilineaceae bacterium]|nr:hypothetical protein [Caldilineaceae bacterium]
VSVVVSVVDSLPRARTASAGSAVAVGAGTLSALRLQALTPASRPIAKAKKKNFDDEKWTNALQFIRRFGIILKWYMKADLVTKRRIKSHGDG